MSKQVSFADLANTIKQQLAGPLDEWVMPWHYGIVEPFNPVSGHTYTGSNAITLINSAEKFGYKSSQWASLLAWAKKGAKVRKGAKATRIYIPIFNGALKNDFDGENGDEFARVRRFRTINVFNGDQMDKYDESHPDMFHQFQNKLTIDSFISECKARINYHNGDAFYLVNTDNIFMPFKQNFVSSRHAPVEHNYYATIIHELIHWTGHPKRLNRPTLGSQSRELYAHEELIAELGTAMICARFDNQIKPRTDHAAYLKSWLQGLDEEYYFANAFKQAQEAIHYLYNLTGIDFHPLSYNPLEESEEYVDEETATEQSTPDTKPAESRGSARPPVKQLVRNIRVESNCRVCCIKYEVTLTRYETFSICPHCYSGNNHMIAW